MSSAAFPLAAFDALQVQEQLDLIGLLWERMARRDADFPLSDAWREELERRVQADDADPDAALVWEDVRSNLLSEG